MADSIVKPGARVERLGLISPAREAALALAKRFPEIEFTSGRRGTLAQARAMAYNIVASENRRWASLVYKPSKALTAIQNWINANPDVKGVGQLADGINAVLVALDWRETAKLSKHLTGEAFDIKPLPRDRRNAARRAEILEAIKQSKGLTLFLEREAGLERWHAQF